MTPGDVWRRRAISSDTLCPGNWPPSPGFEPWAILICSSSAKARYSGVTPHRALATCFIREFRLSRYRDRSSPPSPVFDFAPSMFSATAMVFEDPQRGHLIDWLGNPSINIWAVLAFACWRHAGYIMILYLAGLWDDLFHLPPACGSHTASFALSLRSSQRFASFRSRRTVSEETCSEPAISSVESPPKNFISTTWHFLWSANASAVSPSSKAISAASWRSPRFTHSSRLRRWC